MSIILILLWGEDIMKFSKEDLDMLLDRIYHETLTPSIHMFCPPSIIDYMKEHWDNDGPVKAEIHPSPYEDDKIYVIPKEELEKPIRVVFE